MRRKYQPLPPQERLKEILSYDPETGAFTRARDRGRWKFGQRMGTVSADGYINISVDYSIFRAHRLAFVYMTGAEPTAGIDHINGDRGDNRWNNLREAAQVENGMNRTHQRNNRLGLKGVHLHSKTSSRPFCARIQARGRAHYLGVFATPEEAKAAYDAASKVLHGDFSKP
jgi:hypothetical protein